MEPIVIHGSAELYGIGRARSFVTTNGHGDEGHIGCTLGFDAVVELDKLTDKNLSICSDIRSSLDSLWIP